MGIESTKEMKLTREGWLDGPVGMQDGRGLERKGGQTQRKETEIKSRG